MEINKVPVSVYAEMTPNPAVMKFVANRRLLDTDSVEFRNIEEAKPSPLATRLFHFPFVKEVFISSNYVALNKYDVTEWDEVAQEVRQFIREFLADGGEVLSAPVNPPVEQREERQTSPSALPEINLNELGEIEQRIVEILEQYVRPAVEMDGGNIRFVSYSAETRIVNVQLQGACAGCPSSTLTLQQGILNLFKRMLPTLVEDVVAEA